jgi:hypothetical protein
MVLECRQSTTIESAYNMRRCKCIHHNLCVRVPIMLFVLVGLISIQQRSPVNAWCFTTGNTKLPKQRNPISLEKTTRSVTPTMSTRRPSQLQVSPLNGGDPAIREMKDGIHTVTNEIQRTSVPVILGSVLLCSMLTASTIAPTIANGYDDYLSEPVQVAIGAVQTAKSNDELVKAYENIAEIITEGKGVGGSINFQGVQLDRGYVSDEDTSIYNPGLTLLTETEKTQLVNAVVESKKQQAAKSTNTDNWNNDLEAGYSFLRDRLDPLHMYELRGYLSILPYVGAAMYVVALAVQQLSREVFPVAYIVCATAVFLPIIALVLLGPQ